MGKKKKKKKNPIAKPGPASVCTEFLNLPDSHHLGDNTREPKLIARV